MRVNWKRLAPATALLCLPCWSTVGQEGGGGAPAVETGATVQPEGAGTATSGEAVGGAAGATSSEGLGAQAGFGGGEAVTGGGAGGGGAALFGGDGGSGTMAVGGAGTMAVLGMGVGVPGGGVQAPGTLDEAISHALRANPEVQLARAKVDEARAAYNQTRLKIVAEITHLFRQRDALQQSEEVDLEPARQRLGMAKVEAEDLQGQNVSAPLATRQAAANKTRSAELDLRAAMLDRQQRQSTLDAQLLNLIGLESHLSSEAATSFTGSLSGGFDAGGPAGGAGMMMGRAQAMGGGLGMGGSGGGGGMAPAATSAGGQPAAAGPGSGGQAEGGATIGGEGASDGGVAVGRGGGGVSGPASSGMRGAMLGMGPGGMGGFGMGGAALAGGGGFVAPSAGRPPIPESQKHLRDELDKPTMLDVTDSPLADVVSLLRQQHNMEIQIGPGAQGDRPITLNVRGVKLRDALLLLTDLYPDLCFIVRDYGLLVSTRDHGMQLYGASIPADLPLLTAPPAQGSGMF